ncbi:MAG TPA: FAD-dependent oxidoreductase [Spirochaetales bacterium]|nr:FAD-dependent oxidoreductase [Spirochaetales bacterium]
MSARLSAHVGARVCILGGGGTGIALAWDLALRGIFVTLVEKGEFTSGTTGRHHGQLHCGARYARGDVAIARECMEESSLLKRLVPQTIENNGGLFLALDDEEASGTDEFIAACHAATIPARELSVADALKLEPAANPHAVRAVWVPDASFDAYRLPASFLAGARALGARLLNFTRVVGVEIAQGKVRGVRVLHADGREECIPCDAAVNAGGVWAAEIGALAGVHIPVSPAPGALVAIKGRAAQLVLSRLAPPGDGDILVPQRELNIIGSTQRMASGSGPFFPTAEEIIFLRERAAQLVPALATAPLHAAWAAARPLSGTANTLSDGRKASRNFTVLDHGSEGLRGFFSITGGKATVLRAMAEKAADAVCAYMGTDSPCQSARIKPPSWRALFAPLEAMRVEDFNTVGGDV